ncbi:MAG: ABC transporter ATP-binding protein [Alphaproteobacteria bacterium]
MTNALLRVDEVTRSFSRGRTWAGRRRPRLQAVQGVSLTVREGETLGIVGESGCGKSTLARMIVGLDRPSGGKIRFDGEDVVALLGRSRWSLVQRVQYVFQDPLSSLNPRKRIGSIIEAPLKHLLSMDRAARRHRVAQLLEMVGLRNEFVERYPHEFSGGQAQRISIARALAAEPDLIVLDEPVSALDVSIQAQVLNLLEELRRRLSLTYVFISHDLAVVEAISDRVAVMYFGRVVETGPAPSIFRAPRHPYTRLLLDSAPVAGRRGIAKEGVLAELPDPIAPPLGCAFAPRCPRATDLCRERRPELVGDESGAVACHHPLDVEGTAV